MTADEFRDALDSDKAFQSKRKALVFVSLLLLALVVSGAQIKEVNTFIFRIEFSNYEGLKYLLIASVLTCALRYYSYSEKYRNALFEIWSTRLLSDYRLYYVDDQAGEVCGLLGKKLHVHSSDYDIDNPIYRLNGLGQRSIGLKTSEEHEYYGEVYRTAYFNLNKFDDNWKPHDLLNLLHTELKCRVAAWVKYRETLDLMSPYLLAFSSMLAFLLFSIPES